MHGREYRPNKAGIVFARPLELYVYQKASAVQRPRVAQSPHIKARSRPEWQYYRTFGAVFECDNMTWPPSEVGQRKVPG